MRQTQRQEIAEIEQEIGFLTARKQVLQEMLTEPWPKRLTLYAHVGEDSLWEKGQALGLQGEGLSLFTHFREVALEVDIAEDGTVTIVSCDGRRLASGATEPLTS